MNDIKIGIIGGSGLYEIDGLKNIKEIGVKTPFGEPSDKYISGELSGKKVVFLSRHGRGHKKDPTNINYRANIWGMKKLGVRKIISISAVGSMKEEIKPGSIVIPNQFIDRTTKRISSFFGDGIVAHIQFADPICNLLADFLFEIASEVTKDIKKGGIYLNMEGPQFSTRAESNTYRMWNVDVIGMTNLTEAKLAKEAQICYSTIALVTDYDCWKEDAVDHVSVDIVLEVLKNNIEKAKNIIKKAVVKINENQTCACHESLKYAIISDLKLVDKKVKEKYKLLLNNI